MPYKRNRTTPDGHECVISVECHPEDLQIRGNASAIGEKEDAETERWILAELEAGNQWAWCHVTVRATHTTEDGTELEGRDDLGGCSYKSEDDFAADHNYSPGFYYFDMVETAMKELDQEIENHEPKKPEGYHECDCCGEVVMGEFFCASCRQAECEDYPEDGYYACQVPRCEHCDTPASFMNDNKWSSNCDDECPNAGKRF